MLVQVCVIDLVIQHFERNVSIGKALYRWFGVPTRDHINLVIPGPRRKPDAHRTNDCFEEMKDSACFLLQL